MIQFKLWQLLGYAGLIPFLFLTWLYLYGVTKIGLAISFVFICYSAVIMSFISGSLWLQRHEDGMIMPSLGSNLLSLLAFFSILQTPIVSLILLSLGYLLLIGLELIYDVYQHRPEGYKKMRIVLTVVVVSCHLLMLNALY